MSQGETDSNPDDAMTEQIEALAQQLFGAGLGPNGEVLGMGDDDIVAPSLHELITDPTNTRTTLEEDGKLIGFSMAVPVGKMDPSRQDESFETAYIYYTGVDPSRQGEKLVGPLLIATGQKLRDRGYAFAEAHMVKTQGFADNVTKNLGPAIVESEDNTWWPEIGPQRFVRVDLSRIDPR